MLPTVPHVFYDHGRKINCLVEVAINPFLLWFALTDTGDRLAGFENTGRSPKICREPDDESSPRLKALIRSVPGYRTAFVLPAAEFAARWHQEADPYLFPKRVGKIRLDYPLDRNTPLDVVADWLRDHDATEAADIIQAASEAKAKGNEKPK